MLSRLYLEWPWRRTPRRAQPPWHMPCSGDQCSPQCQRRQIGMVAKEPAQVATLPLSHQEGYLGGERPQRTSHWSIPRRIPSLQCVMRRSQMSAPPGSYLCQSTRAKCHRGSAKGREAAKKWNQRSLKKRNLRRVPIVPQTRFFPSSPLLGPQSPSGSCSGKYHANLYLELQGACI